MHTVKRLAALQEYEEGESNEVAVKQDEDSPSQSPGASSSDWRASISPSRLSNLFDGWIRPTTPASPTRASAIFIPDKKSVSEPKLVEHGTGNVPIHTSDDSGMDDFDLADFEQMVVRWCKPFH
jgi:diaphanous 1